MRAETSWQENVDRAVSSYAVLQQYFATDNDLYLETYPRTGANRYSYHWPFTQTMVGTLAMAGIPDLGWRYQDDIPARLRGLSTYWDSTAAPPGYASYVYPPFGPGGDKFYDDNEWAGLAQVQLYRVTGDADALAQARQIFDFTVAGWDTNPADPAPGGVFWTQAPWNRDRNTVSTMPGAELGLHLYPITGEPDYLEWARRMYDWTNRYLRAPNGLYWDHVNMNGEIERTQWSYNQGTTIGASVLLYRATGHATYLVRAEQIAGAALAYYGEVGYFTQPAAFNAIFFRNLLLLSSANGNPAYRQVMQDYADRAWANARDPQTGLFRFDRTKPASLLDQAALVQISAFLAWDPHQYVHLT